LRALGISEDERVTFQTFDDNSQRKSPKLARTIHGTLAERWEELCRFSAQGAGIYLCVNRTDLIGRKRENIVAVRSLFVDFDGAPLTNILRLKAVGLEPHLVVQTRENRFHVYYKVVDFPLEAFKPTQQRIIRILGSDPAIHDLPRVMRLPGFPNKKDALDAPYMVRAATPRAHPPYTLAQIEEALTQVEAALPNSPPASVEIAPPTASPAPLPDLPAYRSPQARRI